MPRSPSHVALAVFGAGALVACNLITGASDLHVGAGGGGSAGGGHASSSGSTSSGATSSSSSSSSGSTTSSSGSTSSGSTSSSASSSSGSATCSPACAAHQTCDPKANACVCSPGFVDQGGSCVAAAPGDPTTHAQADVCARWAAGHVLTMSEPLISSGAECDAGYLTPEAINDTLARINMFRWMVGLGPTGADASMNQSAQLCANLESWWPWTGGSPHAPPSTSKCYTPEGGGTAGASNIAWGSGNPAQAIDQFIEDSGNESTLGHRRWVLNPPLDPVGIGYWHGGGMYGDAECLMVFSSGGSGPNPPWLAWPPPGWVPIAAAGWTMSFHGSIGGIASAQIEMLRVDDGAPLAVSVMPLSQGYGQEAISWVPSGWSMEAGKTYRVTVTGPPAGAVTYEIKPVACN